MRTLVHLVLAAAAAADPLAAIVKAHVAGDAAALAKEARAGADMRWWLVEKLCLDGHHEAAAAFAAACGDERLETYAGARRASPEARAALERIEKVLAARMPPAEVLAALPAEPVIGTVVSLRTAATRIGALLGARRTDEARTLVKTLIETARELGWSRQVRYGLDVSGAIASEERDWATAADFWRRAAAVPGIAARSRLSSLENAGLALLRARDWDGAIETQRATVEVAHALKDGRAEGAAIRRLGAAYYEQGDLERALAPLARGAELGRKHGDRRGVMLALFRLGDAHLQLDRFLDAREALRGCLEISRELDDKYYVGWTLSRLAYSYDALGDVDTSLRHLHESLAVHEERKDTAAVARVLNDIAAVVEMTGDYARSLRLKEKALKKSEEAGDRRATAVLLGNLGNTYDLTGDRERAIEFHERALALHEELGDEPGVARTLSNLGLALSNLGRLEPALERLEAARARWRKIGDRSGLASSLNNLGGVYERLSRSPDALAAYRAALAIYEELGIPSEQARARGNIGAALHRTGESAEGLALCRQAYGEAAEIDATYVEVFFRWSAVQVLHDMGRHADAISEARAAVARMPRLVQGLADVEGARAREQWSDFRDAALGAARAAADVEACHFLLESGRAGSLLESLGGRAALDRVALPEELRTEDREARAQVAAARTALRRAMAGKRRSEIRAASAAVEKARAEVAGVADRIQRESKAAAAVVRARPAELGAVQAALAPDEAMALYARECALVVTRKDARIVALPERGEHAERLIAPLGLESGVRRLFVSPTGGLTYLPFAAFAGREVVYVPSATTYVLLRAQPAGEGAGVLALGDPDYRGRNLDALPASGAEAKAVGTTVLVGANASETTLGAKLRERERWRAVHFACHGRVNPERPRFSALQLAAGPGGDGELTVLEVFAMRIPADLVVLSACETGKGEVYRSEGVVGFTRAFMFAGAPRVIVSLWKVDDEATLALMRKFYELWRTMPAATALREAQAHVRAREKWRDPRYWAAWQLWGLP